MLREHMCKGEATAIASMAWSPISPCLPPMRLWQQPAGMPSSARVGRSAELPGMPLLPKTLASLRALRAVRLPSAAPSASATTSKPDRRLLPEAVDAVRLLRPVRSPRGPADFFGDFPCEAPRREAPGERAEPPP